MFKPAVLAGKPESIEDFEKHELDGINVYVSKELKPRSGEIRIKMRGFGMFKHLAVEGL